MKTLFTLFSLLVLFTGTSLAQTFSADQRQSLRGIDQMLLVVDFVQDATVLENLNRDEIENIIRRRLAGEGIRLMGEVEWSRSEMVPYLYVYLNVLRTEFGVLTYRIEVNLKQEVILRSIRSLYQHAPTWQTGTLGMIGVNQIPALRDEILDLVDIFIGDYRDINNQGSGD